MAAGDQRECRMLKKRMQRNKNQGVNVRKESVLGNEDNEMRGFSRGAAKGK